MSDEYPPKNARIMEHYQGCPSGLETPVFGGDFWHRFLESEKWPVERNLYNYGEIHLLGLALEQPLANALGQLPQRCQEIFCSAVCSTSPTMRLPHTGIARSCAARVRISLLQPCAICGLLCVCWVCCGWHYS
jgi:hypothetical protein